MATNTIPRFLLPKGHLYLRDPLFQRRLAATTLRHASTGPSSKIRVLEKPTKFNPPSHPSRIRRKPRQYPGAPLAEHEREAQKKRQYPHMMPPEGTFMHWFLTNRSIHVWLTISILSSLAFFTWLTNFLTTTPYKDLLPPNSFFLSHPIQFLKRYWEVYDMHLAYVSAETAERRKQKVEDVRKRSEYRKAHGLDKEGVFGSWTAKSDSETMGPALREGGTGGEVVGMAAGEEQGVYTDFEGRRRPVKKWLGIW